MRSRMIAFCLAIVAVCQFPRVPDLPNGALFGVLLCAGFLCCQKSQRIALPAALMLGMSWGVLDAQTRIAEVLPQALEGADFWVTGEVRGLPQRHARAQQFNFWVRESCFELIPSRCQSSQSLFSDRLILLNYYGDADIEPGQVWRWRVRLNQPHGFANPGGFDYEAWLLMQGFAAKGYVRITPFNEHLGQSWAWLDNARYRLRAALVAALEGRANVGSLLALIMGDRSLISDEQWALFSATGTNHLIVISGLHVGFVALLCFGLGNGLARLSPRLLHRVAAQQVGAFCAITGASAYALLAGFSLPTQRAVVMLSIFMGAQLLSREFPRSFSFWLAMSVVLILNPMSPVGAGFWLSFTAVATLLFALGSYQSIAHDGKNDMTTVSSRVRALWRNWVRPQWVVFIGLSAPLLLWTQQLSILSPVANIVAIPLVSLLIVPLALLATCLLSLAPSLAVWLLGVADRMVTVLQAGLSLISTLSGDIGVWQGALSGVVVTVMSIAACGLLLMPKAWPGKGLMPLFLLPLLWPATNVLPVGRVQLWVLDVGQGLAVLIRSKNHVLLFDTGPAFSGSFDAGSGVILPFLRQQGVQHIDHLVISHGDNDHQGGMAAIVEGISVGNITVSSAPPGVFGFSFCHTGQAWEWDGVHYEFLMPQANAPYLGNDSSCVLRIDTGGHSALLTGDIESSGEQTLLSLSGERLQSTVLIAPHHGSASSSSAEFVAAVQASAVVYSAGYRSQFAHPAPQVSALYAALGVCAWNTALSGALLFELDGQGSALGPLKPTEYRGSRPRFWQLRQNTRSKRLHGLQDKDC